MRSEAAGVLSAEALKEEKQKLVEEFIAALDSVELEPGYEPDRQKQNQVLKNLPDNLVAEMHAHLHAAQIEADFFADRKMRPHRSINEGGCVAGELFEVLVRAEHKELISDVGDEILAVWHNPDRFALRARLGISRNPDLALVEVEGDTLKIKSIGEVKSGLLDARAADQLFAFRQNLETLVRNLSSVDNLEEIGLTEIASSGHRVQIAEDFKQLLFVPAHRNIENVDDWIKWEDDYPEELGTVDHFKGNNLAGFLESDAVDIRRAAFSGRELGVLTDVLLKKIQERY